MSNSMDSSSTLDIKALILSLRHWHDNNDIKQLSSLLIKHGELLLEQSEGSAVQDSLMALPTSWRETKPQLLFLSAQLKAEAGEYREAIHLYEQAAQRYRDLDDLARQVQCFLKLARIYHYLEDLASARFYTDRAHIVLGSLKTVEAYTLAQLHLAMARLAPDIGHMDYSISHAEKALHLYEGVGEISGQLEAILLLAGAANQTGYPQKSLSLLRIAWARGLALDNNSSVYWQLAMGNQEAHCLWYLAKFQEALQVAESTLHLADTIPHAKQRIYLRLLLGNIYRALGHYTNAHTCYNEAEALLESLQYTQYRVWIQVQRAWLNALNNDLVAARQELHNALSNCEQGQAMSFNVFLAATYSLDRQFGAAEQLLLQSKNFYEISGDPLSTCAIHIHLAYVAIQTQQIEKAHIYTKNALTWMTERNLCYLPHWWHNRIVGRVIVFALQHAICPATVAHFLAGPLYTAIDSIIRPLLHETNFSFPLESLELNALLDPAYQIDLSFADDLHVRDVLKELLKHSWLRPENFESLKALMVTGKQRGQTNASLLAVFGLYLQGWSRHSIAERLSIAESTVRNYITLIYEIFDLQNHKNVRPHQRLAHLRLLASQRGYIPKVDV